MNLTEINIDAQTLAAILLGLRIIAITLISIVLWRQIKNIRTLHTDYPAVRWTVLILTLVLLIGQIIPVILDTVVAFGDVYPGRARNPNALGVGYALNNAVKDVVIGALLSFLYFRPGATRLVPPRTTDSEPGTGRAK